MSAVAVPAALWYWPAGHCAEWVAQTRSLVAVGAVTSYWPATHTVSGGHWPSRLHWPAVHDAGGLASPHTASVVGVPAISSMNEPCSSPASSESAEAQSVCGRHMVWPLRVANVPAGHGLHSPAAA